MKYDMVAPCKDCPFRNDITPFLTAERAEQIAMSLLSGKTFPCHKTVDYSDDGDEDGHSEGVVTADSQHCAGALIFLELQEAPNQMMRIAERLGFYDRTKLKMDSPVFETTEDFIFAQDE